MESRRSLQLLLLVALGIAAWLALSEAALHLVGPPGFGLTIADATDRPIRQLTARYLIAPDEFTLAPANAKLTARGVFLARRSGTYQFALASMAPARLLIDGQERVVARAGARPADQPVALQAGPHPIEIQIDRIPEQAGLVLGLREPGEGWHTRPLGPADVVQSGTPPLWLLQLQPWLPALILLVPLAWLARRRQLVREFAALPLSRWLLVAVIALPMVLPLFEPGYYACHEEESFIIRLQQFDLAMRGGVPLGRWWPDPVLGRGYPFLSFYAPLFYLISWPLLRLGLAAPVVLRLVSGMIVLIGAYGTFALSRRRVSDAAALVAVALFVFAPYLDNDLYIRACITETLAFALFPWALWAIERTLDENKPSTIPLLALAIGALGSAHGITSYYSQLFILAWVAARLLLRTVSRVAFVRLLSGGALGFLLSAFFTLPAIVEKPLVWTERITWGYYTYSKHFVPWAKALIHQPGHGPYDMRNYLGAAAMAALIAAVLALFWKRRGETAPRRLALLGLIGTLSALALITPPIGPLVLRVLPLGQYIGFPWRLYVFAACFAPLAAAGALDLLLPAHRQPTVAALAILAIAAGALPRLGSPQVLLRTHIDSVKFLRSWPIDYVTSMNEYLPKAVVHQAAPFDPIARAIGPARILQSDRSPGFYQVHVEATAPAEIEFNAHRFPGWYARIDGTVAPLGPTSLNGLVKVQVSQGVHEVTIRFERTPLRLTCDLISLTALLFCLGWLVRLLLRHRI